MATTEQIARAKARAALARLSGKKLPDEVIARAALNYADAEDEPETSLSTHVFHGARPPMITAVSTTVRPADDGSNDDIVEAEVVDLDEMPPPGDPRRTAWLHDRLGVNELPVIDSILDVTDRFKRRAAPRRKTSFIGEGLFTEEPDSPFGHKWSWKALHKVVDENQKPNEGGPNIPYKNENTTDDGPKIVYVVLDGNLTPVDMRPGYWDAEYRRELGAQE